MRQISSFRRATLITAVAAAAWFALAGTAVADTAPDEQTCTATVACVGKVAEIGFTFDAGGISFHFGA
jgi:hypothetical protein